MDREEWSTGRPEKLKTPFSVGSKTHGQIWGTLSPAPGAAADLQADILKPPPPPGWRRRPNSRSSPGQERDASPGDKTKACGSGSTPRRHSYSHTARHGPAHHPRPPASVPLAAMYRAAHANSPASGQRPTARGRRRRASSSWTEGSSRAHDSRRLKHGDPGVS